MWNSRFRSLSGDPFDNSAGFQFPPHDAPLAGAMVQPEVDQGRGVCFERFSVRRRLKHAPDCNHPRLFRPIQCRFDRGDQRWVVEPETAQLATGLRDALESHGGELLLRVLHGKPPDSVEGTVESRCSGE
jgi:hypothetical protein